MAFCLLVALADAASERHWRDAFALGDVRLNLNHAADQQATATPEWSTTAISQAFKRGLRTVLHRSEQKLQQQPEQYLFDWSDGLSPVEHLRLMQRLDALNLLTADSAAPTPQLRERQLRSADAQPDTLQFTINRIPTHSFADDDDQYIDDDDLTEAIHRDQTIRLVLERHSDLLHPDFAVVDLDNQRRIQMAAEQQDALAEVAKNWDGSELFLTAKNFDNLNERYKQIGQSEPAEQAEQNGQNGQNHEQDMVFRGHAFVQSGESQWQYSGDAEVLVTKRDERGRPVFIGGVNVFGKRLHINLVDDQNVPPRAKRRLMARDDNAQIIARFSRNSPDEDDKDAPICGLDPRFAQRMRKRQVTGFQETVRNDMFDTMSISNSNRSSSTSCDSNNKVRNQHGRFHRLSRRLDNWTQKNAPLIARAFITFRSFKDSSISFCSTGGTGGEHAWRTMFRTNAAVSSKDPVKLFSKRDDMTGVGNSTILTCPFLIKKTGDREGCFKARKIAYVSVVVDCNFQEGKSSDTLKSEIVNSFNQASAAFEKAFNISLGLRSIYLTPKPCKRDSKEEPFNVVCNTFKSGSILRKFADWTSKQKNSAEIASWVLFTKCDKYEGLAGLAYVNTVCTHSDPSDEAGNSALVLTTDYRVIAHEIGHNFGLRHDCTEDKSCSDDFVCCPRPNRTPSSESFIMNPVLSDGQTQFSQCSIGQMCSGIQQMSVSTSCLASNKNIKPFDNAICGNGIVEEGEECDCGGEEACKGNKCCDWKTCKFKPGAVCDDSNGECCENCQFKSADTICRPSISECDEAEHCTGKSGSCPSDLFKKDGTTCGEKGKGLYCASGQCTSATQQCKDRINGADKACQLYTRSCFMICERDDVCYAYDLPFRDGTKCGNGGHCERGRCVDSNGNSVGNGSGLFSNDYNNGNLKRYLMFFLPLAIVFVLAYVIAYYFKVRVLKYAITYFYKVRERKKRKTALDAQRQNAPNGAQTWWAPAQQASTEQFAFPMQQQHFWQPPPPGWTASPGQQHGRNPWMQQPWEQPPQYSDYGSGARPPQYPLQQPQSSQHSQSPQAPEPSARR